jgi:hypothetical protein
MRTASVLVSIAVAAALVPAASAADGRPGKGGVIADHACLDVSKIPAAAVEKAKKELRVVLAHTSHGSQMLSGMKAMADKTFAYSTDGAGGSLALVEWAADLGGDGDMEWAATTRERLAGPDKDRNVVVWAWCWGCGVARDHHIKAYLDEMRKLEAEFPKTCFVRMTGHLDGKGVAGNLHQRNEQIRKDCRETGAPLFDFADIESFDPDGNAFLEKGAKDDCSYAKPDGTRGNWAVEWLARHAGHGWKLPERAAHTAPLNGAMKGRAFWWMLARVAGWSGK